MSYLLSVIVPTKDRYLCLKSLINLIDSFQTNHLELIIQDNTFDNSEILEFLSEKERPNLKYFYTKEPLSVCENSDLAVLNSTGKYVCFIGDDDGVSQHVVECVRWMDENDIEVLKSSIAVYIWPGAPLKFVNRTATLAMPDYKGHVTQIDPMKALMRLLKRGGSILTDMPKLYNGIAKRSILNEIYKITGTFFPGPSPDMANAVALCFVTSKYVVVDFPIIIGGRSSTQGGKTKNNTKNKMDLNRISHLPKKCAEEWEPFIPKIWSSATILAESAVKSLRLMNQNDFIKYLDKENMLIFFMNEEPQFKKIAANFSSNKFRLYSKWTITYFNRMLWATVSILLYRLRGIVLVSGSHTMKASYMLLKSYKNISTIEEANSRILELYPEFKLKEKE